MLMEAVALMKKDELRPIVQKAEEATLAPMIKKEDGCIDWTKGAAELECMIRAFNPWPSAYTSLAGKLLKIFWARVIKGEPPSSLSPATVVRSTPSELVVLTGENFLALEEVQLEGKKRLPVSEFLKGFVVKDGTVLGR